LGLDGGGSKLIQSSKGKEEVKSKEDRSNLGEGAGKNAGVDAVDKEECVVVLELR